MPSKDLKQVITTRISNDVLKVLDKQRLKVNRNRSQMGLLMLNWYYQEYKKTQPAFKTDFTKYVDPDGGKETVTIRINPEIIKQLDKQCELELRNRSQLMECIFIEYFIVNGVLK